jgi:ATP-binding cassette subfamily B protein
MIQASQAIVQIDEARSAVHLVAEMVNRPPEEGPAGDPHAADRPGRVQRGDLRYEGSTTPLDQVSLASRDRVRHHRPKRVGTTVTRFFSCCTAIPGLTRSAATICARSMSTICARAWAWAAGELPVPRLDPRHDPAAQADASFEEVVQAARLAGAEEFIERLPRGYETYIQEGSTNLSGGQRQRLAIARALIGDPRILILDEATSALDADSEAIVNANLLRIAQGRTLIIISHRLSSLVNADAILVLERGRVYDIGTHEELLDRCDIYSGLWHQQHRHLITRPSTHEIIPFPSAAQ